MAARVRLPIVVRICVGMRDNGAEEKQAGQSPGPKGIQFGSIREHFPKTGDCLARIFHELS